MESLEIEGKEYISAKRAAREHSYTMDYVGQLIRGGKLIGKKVGRAWYVENDSLHAYVESLLSKDGVHSITAVQIPVSAEVKQTSSEEVPEIALDVEVREDNQESEINPDVNPEEEVSVPITRKAENVVHHQTTGTRSYPFKTLNYSAETGDSFPQLSSREEKITIRAIADTRTSVRASTKQVSKSDHNADQMSQYAPVGIPQRYSKSRGIARRQSLLPAVVGGAFVVAVVVLAFSASVLVSRTMQYQASTSAVSSGFLYTGF